MTDEIRDEIENLSHKYMKDVLELINDEEMSQVMILVYNDECMLEIGSGCKACAVEAAEVYIELNEHVTHLRDNRRMVH